MASTLHPSVHCLKCAFHNQRDASGSRCGLPPIDSTGSSRRPSIARPHEYVLHMRIVRARRLLLGTNDSLRKSRRRPQSGFQKRVQYIQSAVDANRALLKNWLDMR